MIKKNNEKLKEFSLNPAFFTRNRKLTLAHTVGHVLYLAATRNSFGYETSSQNYFLDLKETLSGASRSSVCEARQKVGWKAFEFLLKESQLKKDQSPAALLWKGHVVRALDGSKIALPHTKDVLSTYPQRQNRGVLEHYPFAILNCAVNVLSGQPTGARITHKNGSEFTHWKSFIETEFQAGDICLTDRGIGGGRVWELFQSNRQYFISRVNLSPLSVRQFIESRKREAWVDWEYRAEKDQDQRHSIRIRLIRGKNRKTGEAFVLATNLPKTYFRADILGLYRLRWKAETMYSRIKTLLNLTSFHARTQNGILQELFAQLLILSITALAVLDTKDFKQKEPLKIKYAPNFKNAVVLVRRNLSCIVGSGVSRLRIKNQIKLMREQIRRIVCPIQPNRSYPRYSRKPVNRWAYAKENKIEQFKRTGKCAA